MAQRYPEQSFVIANEPEGSPVHWALLGLGARETRAQYEMKWSVAVR